MTDASQNKTEPQQKLVKKRDRSASEERLIQAGRKVFSKYGYKGATTKMIAQKAGVNESLIGRYFDGKEGLLIAIIEKFIEEVAGEEFPHPPQDNLTDELSGYLEFKMAPSPERQSIGKIIISHALTDAKFKKRAMAELPMKFDAKLMDRLERLKNNGKISSEIDLFQMCEEVENYIHGSFIFDAVLREMPHEMLVSRARNFAKNYAKGL